MRRILIALLIISLILVFGCIHNGQLDEFNKIIDNINKQTDRYNDLSKKSNNYDKESEKVSQDESGLKKLLDLGEKMTKIADQTQQITEKSISEVAEAKKLDVSVEAKTYLKMLEKALKTRLSSIKESKEALSKMNKFIKAALDGNYLESLEKEIDKAFDKAEKLEGQSIIEHNKADDYHSKNLGN